MPEGKIEVSKLNPSVPLSWLPDNWRQIAVREDLKAKLIALHAFGGEFPQNADYPESISYVNYRGGVRMDTGHPERGGPTHFWRGVASKNGMVDAEEVRNKWWEVHDAAVQRERRREREKKKREQRKLEKEEFKERIREQFDSVEESRNLRFSSSLRTALYDPVKIPVGPYDVRVDYKGNLLIEDLPREKIEEIFDILS